MFRNFTAKTANFARSQLLRNQARSLHALSSYGGSYSHGSNAQSRMNSMAMATAFAAFTTTSLLMAPAQAEAVTDGEDKFSNTKLYPPIQAYSKGMLRVSDIHSIAYSEYGNPKGILHSF